MNVAQQQAQKPTPTPWAFIVVAVILLSCAMGLTTATNFMKLHFRKLPIPPARPLAEVAADLGPWKQVSMDETLQHDMQEALATDKYIFRTYVDTRVIKPEVIAQFKNKSSRERSELASSLDQKAVITLGLTYYTGLADTVAHIPDRCYIADGYDISKYDIVSWDALKGRKGDEKLRSLVFEDTTPGRNSIKRNVAYFFHCNGEYMNDSIAVRTHMARLTETYAYYMKVEIQTFNLSQDQSARVMNDFLTYLLPESEKCLPDWEKVSSSH